MAGELKEVEVRILRERERGIDLADVSAVLGHKDIVATRKHYAPVLSSRLKGASDRLAGRFEGWMPSRSRSLAVAPAGGKPSRFAVRRHG